MSDLAQILAVIDADVPASRARLMAWLRLPSISAQPTHAGDCAADRVRAEPASLGVEASRW